MHYPAPPHAVAAVHTGRAAPQTVGATGEAVTGEAVTGEAVTGEAVTGEAVTGEVVTGEAVTGGDRTAMQWTRPPANNQPRLSSAGSGP
jgi:hypothetical protein